MNIYLTGMMGCGKTTLGGLLAEMMDARFIDLDAEIEKSQGKSISQIFAERGEGDFREIETNMLRETAKETGCVVACGGGIVLFDRNVDIMKRTGKIYFIDRSPEDILAHIDMSGRPVLKGGQQKFTVVYKKRLPVYQKTADVIFKNYGTPMEAAMRLASLAEL